ncbi:glycosyltransferase [Patescibacteria group bacterium]|nr:glycosyltransferase [Patescibacteria group bacterium]
MPSLIIVIPTKNEEEFLPLLLRSIRKQTLQPEAVIVADAGSTDATREIAKLFGARVVEGGLPGPGRNKGATAAQSDLIFFFDADVELRDSNFLQRAIEQFERCGLDMATTDVMPLDGNKYDVFSHQAYNTYVRLWGGLHPHVPGFCILVRKSLHDEIGGFDETVLFCEDHDYALRGKRIGKFGFLSGVKVYVSTRRQERDGRFNMAAKYILAELHIMTLGPIRTNVFNYTFGHTKKEKYGREK